MTMKRFVNESIHPFLKPKTKDEIIDAISNIKVNSYSLRLFMNLSVTPIDLKNKLLTICKELGVEPRYMEITQNREGPLSTMFKEAFLGYGYNEHINQKNYWTTSPFYEFRRFNDTIDYSTRYKIIMFNGYFAFPKNDLKDILLQLANKYFYNEDKR